MHVQIRALFFFSFIFFLSFSSFLSSSFVVLFLTVQLCLEMLACVRCPCRTQHDAVALNCLLRLLQQMYQVSNISVSQCCELWPQSMHLYTGSRMSTDTGRAGCRRVERKERFDVKNTHTHSTSRCAGSNCGCCCVAQQAPEVSGHATFSPQAQKTLCVSFRNLCLSFSPERRRDEKKRHLLTSAVVSQEYVCRRLSAHC